MTACAGYIWARTSACSLAGAHCSTPPMKPSLQFRLSQHLTLTPQLQQSIRLLQLSTVELNQEITWVPDHIKDGSFGKWLANARDWSISRNRFWGSPIPVWAYVLV